MRETSPLSPRYLSWSRKHSLPLYLNMICSHKEFWYLIVRGGEERKGRRGGGKEEKAEE